MSLRRSFLLPIHLFREFYAARTLRPEDQSEFDRIHGLDTDGEIGGWTYLSDLNISSPNWIDGNNYTAIEPERFTRVLASLGIAFEDYTFIDFGSGKGRALLLASEFPFRKIIGLEFSEELHLIAVENIRKYRSGSQKCTNVQSINIDFTAFVLPSEPLVLFFFDPCASRVFAQVLLRIRESMDRVPRPVHLAYIAPHREHDELLASAGFVRQSFRSMDLNFVVYSNGFLNQTEKLAIPRRIG